MEALERWCEAVEARTEAERWAELAAGAGTAEEQRAAAFELESAQVAAENARDRCGAEWLLAFRCALEGFEPGLGALLERLMGTATIAQLEARAQYAEDACAWAVREIDRLKAENWDLAREFVRLRRRVEDLEREQEQDEPTPARRVGRESAGVG